MTVTTARIVTASGASRTRRRIGTALLALAAATGSALGLAGTAAAAPAHPTSTVSAASTAPTAMETQFLGLLNARRASAGEAPMTMSTDLVALSRTWSARMAAGTGLAHDPALAQEMTNYQVGGQNVGEGTDVVTLDNAFWASPGHRANELYPTFTQVGVGVVLADGQVWVTFDFRQPRTTPTTAPTPVKHTTKHAVKKHPVKHTVKHTVKKRTTAHHTA